MLGRRAGRGAPLRGMNKALRFFLTTVTAAAAGAGVTPRRRRRRHTIVEGASLSSVVDARAYISARACASTLCIAVFYDLCILITYCTDVRMRARDERALLLLLPPPVPHRRGCVRQHAGRTDMPHG